MHKISKVLLFVFLISTVSNLCFGVVLFDECFDYPDSPYNEWLVTNYDGDRGDPAVPCSFIGTRTDNRFRVEFATQSEATALGNTDLNFGNNSGAYLQSRFNFISRKYRVSADFQMDSPELIGGLNCQLWLLTPSDNSSLPVTGYRVQWHRSGSYSELKVVRFIDGQVYVVPDTKIILSDSSTPELKYSQYYTVTVDLEVKDSGVEFCLYFNEKGDSLGALGQTIGIDSTSERIVNGTGIGVGLFKYLGRGGMAYVDDVVVTADSYPDTGVGSFVDMFSNDIVDSDIWYESIIKGTAGTPRLLPSFAGVDSGSYSVDFVSKTEAELEGNTDSNPADGSGVYLQSVRKFHATSYRASADFMIQNGVNGGVLCQMWLCTPLDNVSYPDTGYRIQWYWGGTVSNIKVVRFIDGAVYVVPGTEITLNGLVSNGLFYTVTVDYEVVDGAVQFDLYFNRIAETLGALGSSSGQDSTEQRLVENNGIGIGLKRYLGYDGSAAVDNVIVGLPATFVSDISGSIEIGSSDYCVDMYDFEYFASGWGDSTYPSTGLSSSDSDLRTIPRALKESIVIDGDLTEWANAEWVSMEYPYYQEPNDITEAKFATYWSRNDDSDPNGGILYVAISVDDSEHNFSESNNGWDTSDRVEVYLKGIAEIVGNQRFYQDYAQEYIVGVNSSDPTSCWATLGNYSFIPGEIPESIGFDVATAVIGSQIIYEMKMTIFDYYAGFHPGELSEVSQLYGEKTIGFDVVIGTKKDNGVFGMLSENPMDNKANDAARIQIYSLESGCSTADINEDFTVDLLDYATLAVEWMQCK